MKLPRAPQPTGWTDLIEDAGVSDKRARAAAVMQAYSWTGHALDAASIPRNTASRGKELSTADRLLRHVTPLGFSEHDLRQAITVRRRAETLENVPGPDECLRASKLLQSVWFRLRRNVVNPSMTARLARQLRSLPHVEDVCLYGSLARGIGEPNDIDLLLLHDGEYSTVEPSGRYDKGTFHPSIHTIEALEMLGLKNREYVGCAKCRWLDIKVLDGSRFGDDFEYTHIVQTAQPDPWFFVNISRDMGVFVPSEGTFDFGGDGIPFPFGDLRRVYRFMRRYGLYLTPDEVASGDSDDESADSLDDERDESEDTDSEEAEESDEEGEDGEDENDRDTDEDDEDNENEDSDDDDDDRDN